MTSSARDVSVADSAIVVSEPRFLSCAQDLWRRNARRLSVAGLMLAIAVTTASGAELTLSDGVVVKFGGDAGLVVRDRIIGEGSVVFTSLNDTGVGGSTLPSGPLAEPGDWRGVAIEAGALVDDVQLDGADIRYAGSSGAAGLSFSRLPYEFDLVSVRNSLVGVRASLGSAAQLNGLLLRDNGTGIRVESDALPRITGSEIVSNAAFGIENRTPATIVIATGNWWGDVSGPFDPVGNPGGRGNGVSTGVDYGQYLTQIPLVRCQIRAADGQYNVVVRAVMLKLSCRNATEYRLSESVDFGATSFVPMSAQTGFTLSPAAGSKTIYAQFRGAVGQSLVVSTPEPFVYAPSTPSVTFIEPPEGSVLTTNTQISVMAVDVIGITGVEFRYGSQTIGTDTDAPFEILWDVSAIADGIYALTAVATNSEGRTAQATRSVRLQRISPQPDFYVFNEGEVLFVDAPGLLANDQVVSAQGLVVEIVTPPDFGVVQLANDGSFVFHPDTPERNGATSFSYRLSSNGVISEPVNVAITVLEVNDPPNSRDDQYLTDENVQITVPAPGVLNNDSDVDSAILTAAPVTQPAHGQIQFLSDGSFNYVPAVNYRGRDSFQYRAIDSMNASTTATVSVLVTQPPTATNDVYLVDISTPLIVSTRENGLLANDYDSPEDDQLTAIFARAPAHGAVTLQPNGTFTYIPQQGYIGLDSFAYQATDSRSLSNIANVTLAVGIFTIPRAVADSYTGYEDQELVVSAAEGLLINDTDDDTPLEDLIVDIAGVPEGGIDESTLELDPNGGFRVKFHRDFTGRAFFIYKVFDGESISNAAVVTLDVLQVNDGVEANDDEISVARNTVHQANGYGNGHIVDNDRYDNDFPVRFDLVEFPRFGAVELDSLTGTFTYTPQQDFAGTETFVYRLIQPSTGISDTAIVRLRVNGAPVALPDSFVLNEDSSVQVSPSVLFNDSDPDGDPIQLTELGFFGVIGDGYAYGASISMDHLTNPIVTTATATNHFYGTVTFPYRITDGLATASGLITYTVLPVPDDPIAAADSYLVQQNATLAVGSPASGVLHNDFDPDARLFPGGPAFPYASAADLVPIVPELITTTIHGALNFAQDGTFTYVPTVNYSGLDEFTYRLLDGTGRRGNAASVQIRVNTPPSAVDDAFVVNEDSTLIVSQSQGLLINDIDIDADILLAELAGNGCAPCHGQVSIRADGSFQYTPALNYYGPDEFYYRVSDGIAGIDFGRVNLTILPVNDAPITEPDSYRTREDEILEVSEIFSVLRNDEEVDGEALINATVMRIPASGALSLTTVGGFGFTPSANFNGRDTFRYRVFDESNLFADAEVEIIVTAVNDAPDAVNDSYAVDRDQTLTIGVVDGVLANDSDVDGPRLTASLTGPPTHGQINLAGDGRFTYQPNGIFVGIDQFQYQVDDGLGSVDSAIATINVRQVGSPVEITVDDDFYSFEGPNVQVAAPGVLGNDIVSGAPSLVAALVIAPQTGTVVLAADGSFAYAGQPGFSGVVTFTYSASAASVSELALVTLDVRSSANVAPVALGEQFGTLEDGLLDSRSSGSLLLNDRDFEGAPLSLQVLSQPAHGVLNAQSDGQFTFAPAPNFSGNDGFNYRVSDGVLSSNTVTASVTVFAQNDAPFAIDDSYQVQRGQTLNVSAGSGVLANDTDVDGDSISVELVDSPLYGQVQVAADGAFTYQTLPGFFGQDRFRYAATDGAARALALVSINVLQPGNRAPIAQGENFAVDEDRVLDTASAGLLTANDSDPDGDALFVVLVQAPTHGALNLDGAAFSYRPAANYAGADTFRYQVSDGALSSAIVSVVIEVRPINDAPQAATDLYLVVQGQALNVAFTQGVLANDSDVEGSPMSVSLHTTAGHGTVVLAANGGFVYQPNANFHGHDEFGYALSDGSLTSIGRAVIDVTQAANQRPIANGEVFALPEDTVLDTRTLESLLANDSDPEQQSLSLVILSQPPSGQLEVLGGGHIRFTPARDSTGSVRFDYTVSDGELQAVPVQVEIILLPHNDAPIATADLYSLPSAQAQLTVPAASGTLANDVDPDGDTLLVSIAQAPVSGSVNLALDGSFVYTPMQPRPNSDHFIYRIADPAGLSSQAQVDILLGVQPISDAVFQSGFEPSSR